MKTAAKKETPTMKTRPHACPGHVTHLPNHDMFIVGATTTVPDRERTLIQQVTFIDRTRLARPLRNADTHRIRDTLLRPTLKKRSRDSASPFDRTSDCMTFPAWMDRLPALSPSARNTLGQEALSTIFVSLPFIVLFATGFPNTYVNFMMHNPTLVFLLIGVCVAVLTVALVCAVTAVVSEASLKKAVRSVTLNRAEPNDILHRATAAYKGIVASPHWGTGMDVSDLGATPESLLADVAAYTVDYETLTDKADALNASAKDHNVIRRLLVRAEQITGDLERAHQVLTDAEAKRKALDNKVHVDDLMAAARVRLLAQPSQVHQNLDRAAEAINYGLDRANGRHL